MSLETQKMELRSKIKSLEYKKSRLACKMARDCGIQGMFFADELDLNDKRIYPNDRIRFQTISEKLYNATWELDKLEQGVERANARQKVFDTVNSMPLHEGISLLRKHGCLTTFELVEKVVRNPSLLEDVRV